MQYSDFVSLDIASAIVNNRYRTIQVPTPMMAIVWVGSEQDPRCTHWFASIPELLRQARQTNLAGVTQSWLIVESPDGNDGREVVGIRLGAGGSPSDGGRWS